MCLLNDLIGQGGLIRVHEAPHNVSEIQPRCTSKGPRNCPSLEDGYWQGELGRDVVFIANIVDPAFDGPAIIDLRDTKCSSPAQC